MRKMRKYKEEDHDMKLYHNGLKRLKKRLGLTTFNVENSAYDDASSSE